MLDRRIALAGLLLVVVAVHAVDSDRHSVILGGLRNAGHLPMFAVLTLVVAALFRGRLRETVATTVGIAVLAECSQWLTGGETDLRDFATDLLGVGIALAARALWLAAGRTRWLAVPVFALSILPALGWLAAWQARNAAWPCLARFDSVLLNPAQRALGASAVVDGDTLHLTLEARPYAGLRLVDPVPDWRDFAALELQLASEPPADITVRVHDRAHNHEFDDRFNRSFPIGTELTRVRIPLADIAAGPTNRTLDLARVDELVVFAVAPDAGHRITVGTPCLR